MRYSTTIWVILAVLGTGSIEVPAAELEAGVAVLDITPPVGCRMSGYFNERLNTGVKDPLMAKALVLRQGDEQAALVICDLIGISLDVSTRARKQASERTGVPAEHIAIAATHSHTGPLYSGALREWFHEQAVARHGSDPQEEVVYADVLVEKLVEAIAAAHAALVPADLQAGIGQETRLSFNRRFHMKDGTVRFNPGQQNPDIVRVAGPIDPDVGIVRLRGRDDPGGPALDAALVVFAMHLDTVGGTEYSADYPYVLETELRRSLGEGFVSLFGAGTCGDINHIDVSIQGRRTTAEIGTLLAETVAAELPKLAPVSQPDLAVRRAVVDWPLQRYSVEEIAAAREKMPKIGGRELSFLEQVEAVKIVDLQVRGGETIGIEVQAFRLGPDVAIVTLPGEVFVELGLAIKQSSPFRHTLVIELTNDNPAYIPTTKAFAEGSYETVNSRIQPGGGEAMVEAALGLLADLAGGR
jgi:neutral ceramidase